MQKAADLLVVAYDRPQLLATALQLPDLIEQNVYCRNGTRRDNSATFGSPQLADGWPKFDKQRKNQAGLFRGNDGRSRRSDRQRWQCRPRNYDTREAPTNLA